MSIGQSTAPPPPLPTWSWIGSEFLACLLTWSLAIGAYFIPPWPHRSWLPNDPALAYPIKPDSVTDAEMACLSLLLPLFAMLLVTAVQRWPELRAHRGILAQALWVARASAPSWLGLLMCTGLVEVATDTLKVVAAEPRPDFLARCAPDAQGKCTGMDKAMFQGLKAFPSGHASLTAAGMLYLALYLRSTLLSSRRPSAGIGFRVLISSVPMLGSLLISVTRIADNKHDWWDVSAGFLLGIVAAAATFPLYHTEPATSRPASELNVIDLNRTDSAATAESRSPRQPFLGGSLDGQGEANELRLMTQTPAMEEQRSERSATFN